MAFRYKLELRRSDGGGGYSYPVDVDWEPAREAARFSAFRRGLLPPGVTEVTASVAPVWDDELGQPWIRGFEVTLHAGNGPVCSQVFERRYFRGLAERLHDTLIEAGKLTAEERVGWSMAAWPAEDVPDNGGESETGPRSAVLPVVPGSLESHFANAVQGGPQQEGDLPVFVPSQILAEIEAAARAATPMEVGGVLIGHLHRDASAELFSEVTAQIPALDAVGSEAQLNFPPKAWATVRAAVNLRARREIWMGWWHSHPVRAWEKCRECGPERQEQCALATAFFSAQDRVVHRTVFSRAHMVGLVANDLTAGVRMAMFGWRDGSIEQRGFHVTGGEDRALIRVTGGEVHVR